MAMADYHHVYESAEKEDTEWDAIQRRLGNLPPKPKTKPPPKFAPKEEGVQDEEFLKDCDEEALEDLEDDFDDDPFLEEYRKKRMAELRAKSQKGQEYGSVTEIRGGEFIQQVTEASEGTWVVVLLYQPRHANCEQLESCLNDLAADFPLTKFVKILSEECIPGYPRHNLPTLLVYSQRSCKKNLVGTDHYRMGRVTTESVAEALNAIGPVCK